MQEMARPHKPWFRKQTRQWYVEIEGTQHCLGPDKDEAIGQFHDLMATSTRPHCSHFRQLLGLDTSPSKPKDVQVVQRSPISFKASSPSTLPSV